jgi:mannitol-specific phosphotransferase system IIBC component
MRQQIFQFSAIAAFLSGGTLAVIPLDSIAENVLGVAVAFIVVNVAGLHSQTEMDEKLKQAQTSADLARQKTQEKQSQLSQFKKQLGEYIPAS